MVVQASRLQSYFEQTRCLHHKKVTFCRSVLSKPIPLTLSSESGMIFEYRIIREMPYMMGIWPL